MRHTLIALLLAVGVLPSAVAAAGGAHHSSSSSSSSTIIFFPPPPPPATPDHSSDKKLPLLRPGGNGQSKDKLDARMTTMPECRMIDPTDREAKYACLVGQKRANPSDH
jgi:hypothetical protein